MYWIGIWKDQMNYIDIFEDLEAFAKRAKNSRILALDTEFIRERTYYPRLCLLQAATDAEIAIIDPLSIRSLEPLKPLLLDESITKIFHSASQDLEILYHVIGCLPKPVFDTQIAAGFLGQTHQIGLGSLVAAFCGVPLKKSDSFTDWEKRPLAASQIKYAAEDVAYLPELYDLMTQMLKEKGRTHWLDEEFESLCDPRRYDPEPFERYKRLKRVNQLNGRQLACAREVAAWREEEAIRRNVPRKWVLSDEQVVEACKREPKSVSELLMVRGMKKQLGTKEARKVSEIIANALKSDPSTWPKLDNGSANEPNVDFTVDLMEPLLRLRAKENGIAVQSLASHPDLVQLARGHFDSSPLMKGWRRDLVGNELVDLANGKIGLSVRDNELVISARD